MRKLRLFTPGPTPIIPAAQAALTSATMHHRTPEFKELLKKTVRQLKLVFKTENDVLLLAASGTGAMEAAVSNLLAPGTPVVVVVAGKFGERWLEIASRFKLEPLVLEKDYGEVAQAEEIARLLKARPETAALLLQGCETSTASMHDLETISREVRRFCPDLLIIVDAITALGSQPVETDRWDLDVVIGGSQKAFGIPPGLSFLSLSARAKAKLSEDIGRSYYFDLRKELDGQAAGSTAYTPAVALIAALEAATGQILDQGLDAVVDECERMARCTRSALQAMGFTLLSSAPSNAVTAAFPPPAVKADELRSMLESDFGIKVAGGQGKLKGEIIRIAHLGYFDMVDVFGVLGALERCLRKLGAVQEPGIGVKRALLEESGVV